MHLTSILSISFISELNSYLNLTTILHYPPTSMLTECKSIGHLLTNVEPTTVLHTLT